MNVRWLMHLPKRTRKKLFDDKFGSEVVYRLHSAVLTLLTNRMVEKSRVYAEERDT